MNIVEFLDRVGHTKLGFQILNTSITNVTQGRGHAKVTFGTTQFSPGDLLGTPRRVGVVVWMDHADYERARKS